MKLSKTSEYAVRILSFMAKSPGELYSARHLIEELKISDKYLRRLMTDLSKAGFIRSIQGREGGYIFNKDISEISLSAIIDAVEGMDKYMGCVLGFEECSEENPCVMHESWLPMRKKLLETFNNKTLADFNYNNINKF
ncbi:MAG: Rrf2 family transcriptional regulator [Chlorobi bacterium]|nr:Rrf2 family transcriptional regulator [Chlorobiota bacterium]